MRRNPRTKGSPTKRCFSCTAWQPKFLPTVTCQYLGMWWKIGECHASTWIPSGNQRWLENPMENSQLGIPMEFALLTLALHGDGDLPRHGLWFSSKCCLIFWAMVVPVIPQKRCCLMGSSCSSRWRDLWDDWKGKQKWPENRSWVQIASEWLLLPKYIVFFICFPSPVDKRTRSNKHCSIDSELWNQVKLPWHFVPSHVPFPNVNLIWYCLKAVPTKTTSQSVSCICPVSNMNPLKTLRPVFFYVHSISVNQMGVITHYIIYIYI